MYVLTLSGDSITKIASNKRGRFVMSPLCRGYFYNCIADSLSITVPKASKTSSMEH